MTGATKPDNLFDVRVVERNISEGIVTREEYEAHLSTIADEGDNLDESNVVMTLHTRARRTGVADSEDDEA